MSIELPHEHGTKIEKKVNIQIPAVENFYIISELFKLLGDSSRLQIFWILCHTEECVINLASMLDMTSPAVSHHLKILKSNKLIESKRQGKEVYYKVSNTEKTKMLHITIEKVMEISCPERKKIVCQDEFADNNKFSEQVKIVHDVHKYLINNLEKRITIESLSKQFLINPTTLKDTFKAEFGSSIAAHIKEHRMEYAAELLVMTSKSVSEIASAVGYASQGKFASSFYKYYNSSPLEYRKRYSEKIE